MQVKSESLSKALGAVLTDISCEIIEQLFGELSRSSHSLDGESEKIIQQVHTNHAKIYAMVGVVFWQ